MTRSGCATPNPNPDPNPDPTPDPSPDPTPDPTPSPNPNTDPNPIPTPTPTSHPDQVRFTVLDATIGLDPATLAPDDLGAIRVTPAPSSRFYNKPADSSAAPTAV